MKKALLFILLVGGVLAATFAYSECSKITAFEQERTYVFYSAQLQFNDQYERDTILNGKTEQQFIDSYPGLKQTKFIFKKDGSMYAPKENTVSYAYYYELKEGVITVYDSKGGEKYMTFEVSGDQIKTKLYYFESIGTGNSYFDAVFTLSA